MWACVLRTSFVGTVRPPTIRPFSCHCWPEHFSVAYLVSLVFPWTTSRGSCFVLIVAQEKQRWTGRICHLWKRRRCGGSRNGVRYEVASGDTAPNEGDKGVKGIIERITVDVLSSQV